VIYLALEWFQEHVLDKVPFLRSGHTHLDRDPDAPSAPPGKQPIPAAVH
jgi:hypothetical protein